VAQGALGRRHLATCIDHAGVTHPKQLVPEEKRVGRVTDAWVDDEDNLMAISTIEEHRPEADLMEESLRQGKRWGVSLNHRLIKDPARRGDVAKIDTTHLGYTMVPDNGEIGRGSWIEFYTRDPAELAAKMKKDYLPRARKPLEAGELEAIRARGYPHAMGRVPPETLARYDGAAEQLSGEVLAAAGRELAAPPSGDEFVCFSSLVLSTMSGETPSDAPKAPEPVAAPTTTEAAKPFDANYYDFLGRYTEAEGKPGVERAHLFSRLLEEGNGSVRALDMLDESKPVSQAMRKMQKEVQQFNAAKKKGQEAILQSGYVDRDRGSDMFKRLSEAAAQAPPTDRDLLSHHAAIRNMDEILAAAARVQQDTQLKACARPSLL